MDFQTTTDQFDIANGADDLTTLALTAAPEEGKDGMDEAAASQTPPSTPSISETVAIQCDDVDIGLNDIFPEANQASHGTETAIDGSASTPALCDTTLPATDAREGGKGGKGENAAPSLPPSTAPFSEVGGVATDEVEEDNVYRPAPATNPVLDALRERGLYRSYGGGNRHHITCPFTADHQHGPATAVYSEPSENAPLGSFFCPGHREHRPKASHLIKLLGVDREAARCKPRIKVRQGEMHRVVAAAEKVLADQHDLYRSNGLIVRLKVDPVTDDVTTEAVTEQSLAMLLSASCSWEKFDGRADDWRRCDVPSSVVSGVLKNQTVNNLPVLNGLVRQPYLRRGDGALIMEAGYDANTGIYAAFDPAEYKLPLLTKENALSALRRLQQLLVEFEFDGNADRATACCAMLTASVRNYLDVAPGFNITASSPGSGKSYLASVITPFSGPGDARNISYPATSEEATKVVLSLALEQPAAVCFDDMTTDWLPHGAMNRMLTSGSITERVLGSSRVVTAKTASFIMGTGNNIRPIRDMARRVASIYLLPKTENAAMRDYAGRPAEEVKQHRGAYVSDALTIIAAWKAAGSPKADVPNIGGFEQWSDLCRHSLIWLGEPDPAESLIAQISFDPEKETLSNLLRAWNDKFGQKAVTVRRVLKSVDDDKQSDLAEAVMETPCVERGLIIPSKFGRYLARNKNRIVNGLQLLEAPTTERRAWGVVAVSETPRQPLPIVDDKPEGFESVWQEEKAKQDAAA